MTETNDTTTETTTNRNIPNIAVMALLGVLILTATVQAIELNDLRSDLEELPALVEQGKTVSVGTSGGTDLDESIDALPQMVGGC